MKQPHHSLVRKPVFTPLAWLGSVTVAFLLESGPGPFAGGAGEEGGPLTRPEAEPKFELAARLLPFCTHVPKSACLLGISPLPIFLGIPARFGVGYQHIGTAPIGFGSL